MIGIDVAKDTLQACRWDPGAAELSWEKSYPNTRQGVHALLAESPAEVAWVLEPTSRYGELAVAVGQQAGRRVLSAPPAAAKAYLRSENPRAKTDRIDARGLARFGNQAETKLREYRLKEAPLQVLWQLLQIRCQLAQGLAGLRQQRRLFRETAGVVREKIRLLQQEVKQLEEEITRAGQQLELFVRLDAVPGIGPLTAACLTVRLLTCELTKRDSLVAYAGLDLRVHESGTHKGKRGLTKQGDAQLRWLLYLAAKATLRAKEGTAFQAYYARKVEEGWPKTAAICMLARKLARLALAMARSGQPYDPARALARVAAPV
jgi:transposase